MGKLAVFNQVSLDGYFTDKNGDVSWAHKNDPEWDAFVGENAKSGGTLLFGRITYEMMASFWPTTAAMESMPDVAEGMNKSRKIVFSRTLKEVTWENTTLLKGDLEDEVSKLKSESDDIVILGSGSIVSQLAQAGLIDEYQMIFNPIVLGQGRTMFETVKDRLKFKLTNTRSFKNGNVVLTYQSA